MFKKILIGLGLISVTAFSNAALISVDWKVANDGLLTLDTSTGLEWLDVTQSFGKVGSDVPTLTGIGGLAEGFRWATQSEFRNLYADAGLTTSSSSFSPNATNTAYISSARALQALLGYYSGPSGAANITGYFTAGLLSGVQVYGLIAVYDYAPGTGTDYYRADSYGVPAFFGSPTSGLYLVRDVSVTQVPEPASLMLLCVSIAGLAFSMQKRAA